VESSHRGLRRRVAALALEVVVSKSETQGQPSGCEEQSGRTWSSLYLNSRDKSGPPSSFSEQSQERWAFLPASKQMNRFSSFYSHRSESVDFD
jgi:hypothetical protein